MSFARLVVVSMRSGIRPILWALLFSATLAHSVVAQTGDAQLEEPGPRPSRAYLKVLPWESIDLYAGGLTLQFTDLVLPGNAGFDLRITRSYNSKGARHWVIGPGFIVNADASAIRAPKIITSDAGEMIAFLDQTNPNLFRTSSYWEYHRDTHQMMRPDGVIFTYDCYWNPSGQNRRYPTSSVDAFGNNITFEYDAGAPCDPNRLEEPHLTRIVQHFEAATREVNFTYLSGHLRTMTYLGRTWTYTWVDERLTDVAPPLGPGWHYAYEGETARINRVSLPNGGAVEYSWVSDTPLFDGRRHTVVVKTRRAVPQRGLKEGTWVMEYAGTETTVKVHGDETNLEKITQQTRYVFDDGTASVGDAGCVKKVERWEGAQATLLETQALSWRSSADVGFPDETADANRPLLSLSTITRGTKTWTTQYWYHETDFNDYGQPWKIVEGGNFDRTTTYTFWSSPSRYIRGRIATEDLVAGGVSYRRSFIYADADGFLKSKTVHGNKVTLQADLHGNVGRQCDGGEVDQNCVGGIGVTYQYAWGVASRADHGEYVETRQINQDGTVDWEERNASAPRPNDGSGYRQSWRYDDLGRVTQAVPRTTPDGGTTTVTYDNLAAETVETRRKNSIAVQELDGYGRVVRTLNAVDVRTSREYDPLGRVVVEDHPYMKAATPFSTLIDYDALGRVVKKRFPDGTQVARRYGVDANGLLEVTTDEPGRNASETLHTTEKWEASGTPAQARLVAFKDARGFWTKYTYNGLGLLVAVCGPGVTEEAPCDVAAAPRTWTYFTSTDSDGITVGTDRLSSETHPESGAAEYSYYPSGQLQTRKDAANVTTTFGYDAAGRLRSKTVGGRQTLFEYDVWDNRTVADNGDVRTVWTYHAGTWLVRREDFVNGHDFVTDYPDYDEQDNAREIDYPSGLRIHVNVDQESRVTNVLNQDSGLSYARVENSDGIHPDYHPSGVIARYVLGNGVIQETKFEDAMSHPTHITSGPASVPYLDLTYGYDPRGNVNSITDPRAGQTQTYGYDENDALSTAAGGWGAAGYTYDAEGNRKTATRNGNSTEYHYVSGRLQSTTGAAAETFSYDSNGSDGRNGRITGDARGTYSYTTEGLLEQAAMAAGVAIHYTYDADGLRATKTVSGATTYYVHGAAGELLTEFEDNGTVTARDYVYLGSRLVASVRRTAALPPSTPPTAAPFPRTPVPPSVPVPADHWKAEYFDNMTLSGTPVSAFDEGQGSSTGTGDTDTRQERPMTSSLRAGRGR